MTTEKKQPVFVTVDALRPDSKGVSLNVKVVDAKEVLSRPAGPKGGGPLKVAEVLVGDHTGVIVLTARNEQADLAKPGATITLRNAKVDMYRGSMRLAVDQFGKVESYEQDIKTNTQNNMSLIEFELIMMPTANGPAP